MKSRILLTLLAALFLSSCTFVCDDSVNGLPLHKEKLSDNAIRLWVGDHISSTAVSALNTDKGIVVIDATESPALDKRFRQAIAEEFGRDDFVYLINTHEHRDHTTGNGVYSDCEIIAHENCAKGMRQQQEHSPRTIEWLEKRIPELEQELAEAEKGTDQHEKLAEELIVRKMVLESLQSNDELVSPTKTFSDSMTLDMDNMILELYYVGGTHTASDIFVFVPEEGLLFTGDMMADTWLTDTPGCLQAFAIRQGIQRDIPLLLKHWKSLIARKDEIKDYVPAHWNGDLSYEGFVDRYNYVETMYAGITDAVDQGKRLSDLFAEFKIQDRYPNLAGTPGFTEEFVHNGTILALWTDATGATSATEALAAKIDERGVESAVAEIRNAWKGATGDYYFLEFEFNQLGYRYLNEEKLDEAIAVFRLNVEMHPESWNVYDSLGEGYMKSGQYDLAVNNYNRSIELNPDNENGKRMLEEMHTVLAKN